MRWLIVPCTFLHPGRITCINVPCTCSRDATTCLLRVETRCEHVRGASVYSPHSLINRVSSNSCPATNNFEDNQGSFELATAFFQVQLSTSCCVRSLCLSLLLLHRPRFSIFGRCSSLLPQRVAHRRHGLSNGVAAAGA